MSYIDPILKRRYSRQVLFSPIGEKGQKRIMAGRALLIGCGGLGTIIADMLVRAGTGLVRVVDRDFVEENNLQRQILFDTEDVKKNLPKVEAARRKLTEINPHVEIEAIVRDMDSTNIIELMKDVDVVLDGTDNFEARYLINDAAISLGKPWVYGAVVGSLGMAATIIPGVTPCLKCLYEHPPPPGATPTCDTAGILASAVHMIASIQVSEALKLLSGQPELVQNKMFYMDVWKGEYRVLKTGRQKKADCEACGQKHYTYLDAERGSFVTSMCGRNAVQLSWKEKHDVDLEQLAETLRASGDVFVNRFLLRFSSEEARITVFPDGRAIVEGTTDMNEARKLYAKFIG